MPAEPTKERRVDLDLTALEERFKGRMGFAFASEGVRGGWREDERFVYCSTFKMYLAAATLIRAQNGLEQLDRAVPVTQADMIPHAPITQKAVGGTLTIKELMRGTVEESDNPAANILIREMGGLDVLRQFYRDLGDQTTRVDRLEPEMNRLDGDRDTILPAQSVRNIERLLLAENSPLVSENKRLLLEWMVATPTGADRIRAGTPSGWTVAHKTGTGGYGPVNDIGILYPVSGPPIVMAAYFHGSPQSTPQQREDAIAEATRRMLVALGHG
ncbi:MULTISPECIES: class A beta-lactamase [unclassified Brevundimonas]|uniref:class A beta-lactamase n=1 Tax=unclassified Brevundimonas TaxID=2622653 RepID=UPI0025BC867D|nr:MULTISPECIES: class A beta-lactamase [unclassified Brevundimonas]